MIKFVLNLTKAALIKILAAMALIFLLVFIAFNYIFFTGMAILGMEGITQDLSKAISLLLK